MGVRTAAARTTTTATSEPSDGALVRRHLAGDEQAFVDIYERFYPRLVLYCRQRVADLGVAEDLAQDAFVRALEALDRFDLSRPLWPWLKTIARRLAIDHARTPDLEVPASEADEPYVILDTLHEERIDLERTLDNVNERHSLVLRLWYVEDWAADDVCDLLGVNRNTLDQLLHRARARLREEYQRVCTGARAFLAPFAGTTAWASDVRARLRAAAHDPMLLGGIAPVEAARQAVTAALIGFVVVGSGVAPGPAGSHGSTLTSSTATFAASVASHQGGVTGSTWHDHARPDPRGSARADRPSHATGPEQRERSVEASSHTLVHDGEGDVSARIVRGRDTSGESHVAVQASGDADGDGNADVTVAADLRCTTNPATQTVCDTVRTARSNVPEAQVGAAVGGSLGVAP